MAKIGGYGREDVVEIKVSVPGGERTATRVGAFCRSQWPWALVELTAGSAEARVSFTSQGGKHWRQAESDIRSYITVALERE